MHAPALGFVCGGGTEGDDSRLRRCGVGGGCGEVVTCLPTCSSTVFRRRLLLQPGSCIERRIPSTGPHHLRLPGA